MTDPFGRKTAYTYDPFGDVLTTTELATTVNAVTTTLTYEQTFHQVKTVTDPLSHVAVTNTHNLNGTLASTKDALNHSTSFVYFPNGQLNTVTDPLAHVTTYGYTLGEIAEHTHKVTVTASARHARARDDWPINLP